MEPQTPDARILIEHREFIRRLALGLLRDPHAAEDVAQEVLVRAIERPPGPGNLKAWLGRVARNLSISRIRSEQRRGRRERAVAAERPLPPVDEAVGSIELQQRVVAIALELPEPYRATVIHRYWNDLGPSEIAKRSGISRETVKTRLRRALNMVRTRLDDEHRGDRRAWSMLLLPLLPRGGGGALATVTGGAILMGTKLKVAAVIVILVVIAGLGVRQVLRPGDRSDAPEPPPPALQSASTPNPEDQHPPSFLPPIDLAAADRDLDLHGVVVDAEGNPVAGAGIRTIRRPFRRMLALLACTFTEVEGPGTSSASDGSFSLLLLRGEQVDLLVRAEGFAPVIRRGSLTGERVRIVLPEGSPLTIRAVSGNGQPIEGVHLLFVDFGVGRTNADGGAWHAPEKVTGADGTCTFSRAVAAPLLQLIAWHKQHGLVQVKSYRHPESGEFEFVLDEGPAVAGMVRDSVSGNAVAGAKITTVPFFEWFSVETDAEGRFSWPAWRGGFDGRGTLFVSAANYPLTMHQVVVGSDQEIILGSGGRVEGRLVDPDGQTIADALVITLGKGQGGLDTHDSRSGPDGRFALHGLSPHFPHTLIALAPGFGRTLLDLDPAPGAGETTRLGDLVLPAGRRIEGRLLDATGQPVPHELVSLAGANHDRGRLRPGGQPLDSKTGAREKCVTDDLGRFRFRDLAPGTYELSMRSSQGLHLTRTVKLESTGDILDADLRPKASGGFAVRVIDEASNPVPDAIVTLYSQGAQNSRSSGPTDRDGLARLDISGGAREGAITVVPPRDRSLLPISRSVRWTDPEITVTLIAAGTISGTVLDPEGKSLASALLFASWEERGSQHAVSDAEGRFSVRVPAKARVKLTLTGQVGTERRPFTGELGDLAAGVTDAVLRAQRYDEDRTLRIRVVDPSGEPLAGITVAVPVKGAMPVTDEFGVTEVNGLPGKKIQVLVFRGPRHEALEKWALPERLEVVPEGQEVLLRFREAAPISGKVTLPDGNPARVVVIARDSAGDTLAQVLANPLGAFVLMIPAGQPGPLTLEIRLPQGLYPELRDQRIPNIEPGTTGLEFRLKQGD